MATAPKASADKYADMILIDASETAANAGGSTQINLGYGLLDRAAMKIIRIETNLEQVARNADLYGANNNSALFQIGTEASVGPNFEDQNTIVFYSIQYKQATAVGYSLTETPRVFDWSNLPEGGLLVPVRPLFLNVRGSGLNAAMTVTIRLYFQLLTVNDADYIEMLQSRGVFGG